MALFTTKDIAQARLAACFACDHITTATPKRCDLCHCYMRAKVQLRKAACPLGRWSDAPLVPAERQDYAAYWRDENSIIASEMATVPAHEAEYALSHRWSDGAEGKDA